MSSKRADQLARLTASQVASDDLFLVHDVSEKALRAMSRADFSAVVNGATFNAAAYGGYNLAAINAAASAAHEAGGGVVFIPPAEGTPAEGKRVAVWDVTGGSIQCYPGVSFMGIAPELEFTNECPDLGWFLVGGTILQGDGTNVLFTDNAVAGGTVTFDTAADTANKTAHGFTDEMRVFFETTDTLPTGITQGVQYYVVNATANTFQVSSTRNGAPINLGGTPAGTHTLHGGDSIAYATFSHLGIENVLKGFRFGAEESNGLAFSVISDIVANTSEDWLVELYNPQHVQIHHVHGFDIKRGIRTVAHFSSCAPGHVKHKDCFLNLRNLFAGKADYPRRYGYAAENTMDAAFQNDLNTYEDCQVNIYGPSSGGTTADTTGTLSFTNATNTVNATAHGLSSGDPVRFYGSDLPNGIVADTPYFASVTNANSFTIYSDEELTTQVTFSDDGTGTRTLRYYPGDTVGCFFNGIGSSAVIGIPHVTNGVTDGVQNNAYRLRKTRNAYLQLGQLPAVIHGERVISLEESNYALLKLNDVDATIFAQTSDPYYVDGLVEVLPGSQLPRSVYNNAGDTTKTYMPVSATQQMVLDATDQSFGVEVTASNTWPSVTIAPVRYGARDCNFVMGKDRIGANRFAGLSAGVTHTLPLAQSVAIGAMVCTFNDDATHNVTVTAGGSDTINGTDQDLTVGPAEVAYLFADNSGSNTNWIGWVVGVTDS